MNKKYFKYYLPGIILILIKIMIAAVQEILVAFLAPLIIMAGIGVLCVGHKIGKPEIGFRHADEWFSHDDFTGRGFAGSPVFIDWNRWF